MKTLRTTLLIATTVMTFPVKADEWDPPINSKIEIVQTVGKRVEVESVRCMPVSAVRWYTSMTYNFKISGATSDAKVEAPTKLRLVGVNTKKIRNLNLVKFGVKDGNRIWKMKATSSSFAPFPDYEVIPLKECPEPVKGEDGVATLALPKNLAPGEYGLQISAEVWDFTVK